MKKDFQSNFLVRMREASEEIHCVRSLTGGAMLTGISAILNRFTIVLTPYLRISFAFLAVALTGMFYGPFLAGMMGVVVDLLRYMVVGGGQYFPGFTLNEFLVGFLYGFFLYRKPVTIGRVFLAKLAVMLLINFCLTPLWMSILYGDSFIVLLSARILKNFIMLPVETAMLYVVCKRAGELKICKPCR